MCQSLASKNIAKTTTKVKFWAAIAQWFRLRLQSFHPAAQGSNPKHNIYAFSNCILNSASFCEKDENKQKEAEVGPFIKAVVEKHAHF